MQALEGITVLDLSRRYPGAYTAMFLGDFGADIIKVDRPGTGSLPVAWADDSEAFSAHYAPDRNKRSALIDLGKDAGRQVFYRLVERADVLVEGFRPGVMKRLKADYETLREINPRLIYCSLSGYGQDGPYAAKPGHDQNYISIGGVLSQIGPRGGQPYFPSNYMGDMAGAGLHGAIGILLALAARDRTGKGQFVDISYLDGVISMLAMDATQYFLRGIKLRRGETNNTGGVPWCQTFRCKDGEYYTISCAEPHFWENLCKTLGLPHLIPHQNPPTLEKTQEVAAELQEVFATRTRDEWAAYFEDKEVCGAPVYWPEETFQDPQVRHRQMVMEMQQPGVGTVKQVGIPIKLSDTPGTIRSLGVPLGTHTEEVLAELGYGSPELQELRASGAIG